MLKILNAKLVLTDYDIGFMPIVIDLRVRVKCCVNQNFIIVVPFRIGENRVLIEPPFT